MTGGEGEETSSPPKRKEDFDDETDENKRLKIDAEEHIALSPEPIQAHRPPNDDAGVSSPSPQHPPVGSIHPPFPGYPMYGYYYPPPPFGHPPFLQTTPNKSEGTSRSPPSASKSDHHGETKASGEELDELKDASAAAESNVMSTPNTVNRPQPLPFPFPPGFSPSNMPPFLMPYGRSPPSHMPIPPPPYPPGGANNPHNMFMAMMMMHSHGRTPAAQGTPLFMQCDVEQLSDYQSLLRKQLELFQAGPEDIECNTQGRKKPVVLGQVGLRCRHCSGYPLRSRGRGAVYYPSKLLGVYQAAQNMASSHLIQACQTIPAAIRDDLKRLRERKDNACGGKHYWADGCRALGVVEMDEGMFFQSREQGHAPYSMDQGHAQVGQPSQAELQPQSAQAQDPLSPSEVPTQATNV